MKVNIVKKIKSAPKNAGIYIFYNGQQPLYIGKAANLKARLSNYLKITDHKTSILNKEATRLNFVKCDSPIAALIEEAGQIKNLEPRLNTYWRDDKSYHYAYFTKDKYPRIFTGHVSGFKFQDSRIGPFTDGRALKLILRVIRRRYPYCTCRQDHRRDCLNSQIGLCPGYCCAAGRSERSEESNYQKNIKTIKDVLIGKKKKLLASIVKPTDQWAAENIISHSNYLENAASPIQKIECYDISNLAGKEAVGAMTVLVNSGDSWQADKNQFRKFKIKSANRRDDPKMIAEILQRRLNHPEWPYPDLIVIDGGITQFNAAKKVVGDKIRLISFAKPKKQIIGADKSPVDKNIIEKIIKQTHNFAIRYHRQSRSQAMIK